MRSPMTAFDLIWLWTGFSTCPCHLNFFCFCPTLTASQEEEERKKVCVVCVDSPFASNGASTSLDINFSVFMNLRCGSWRRCVIPARRLKSQDGASRLISYVPNSLWADNNWSLICSSGGAPPRSRTIFKGRAVTSVGYCSSTTWFQLIVESGCDLCAVTAPLAD